MKNEHIVLIYVLVASFSSELINERFIKTDSRILLFLALSTPIILFFVFLRYVLNPIIKKQRGYTYLSDCSRMSVSINPARQFQDSTAITFKEVDYSGAGLRKKLFCTASINIYHQDQIKVFGAHIDFVNFENEKLSNTAIGCIRFEPISEESRSTARSEEGKNLFGLNIVANEKLLQFMEENLHDPKDQDTSIEFDVRLNGEFDGISMLDKFKLSAKHTEFLYNGANKITDVLFDPFYRPKPRLISEITNIKVREGNFNYHYIDATLCGDKDIKQSTKTRYEEIRRIY